MRPDTKPTELQIRWLRLKRHLRSVNTSARALRDETRALSTVSEAAPGAILPTRSRLCRAPEPRTSRLAA